MLSTGRHSNGSFKHYQLNKLFSTCGSVRILSVLSKCYVKIVGWKFHPRIGLKLTVMVLSLTFESLTLMTLAVALRPLASDLLGKLLRHNFPTTTPGFEPGVLVQSDGEVIAQEGTRGGRSYFGLSERVQMKLLKAGIG